MKSEINSSLFDRSSHSPSLIDLVGYEKASQYIDFCFIANPYYPTEEMIQLMIERFRLLIKTYPKSNTRLNYVNLSKVLGIDPDLLIIGNGATELITDVCEHFVESLGIPIPTFAEYIEKSLPSKVFLFPLDRKNDYQLDLDKYLDWLKAHQIKAALIINPSNPTGQLFSLSEMNLFLKKADFLDLVIIDESFIDFADKDSVPTLLHSAQDYPNLLIVRSMSKHCGVPGLRLGYAYSSNPQLVKKIKQNLPTWNINTLAEYYLSLLPSTDKEYHEARIKVVSDMQHLYHDLQGIEGLYAYPTGANFVLVKLQNGMTGKEIQKLLLKKYKMYVRDCSNKQGMDDYHIRIATQGRDEDLKLVEALKSICKNSIIDNYSILRKRSPRILIPTAHHLRKTRYIQYVGDAHLNLVLENGGVPLMLPNIRDNFDHIDMFLSDADGILLVEGEDINPDMYDADPDEKKLIDKINKDRDRIEQYILEYALERDIPILAICRGFQLLNVTLGGTLYTDVQKLLPSAVNHRASGKEYNSLRHEIKLEENSLLQEIYGGAKKMMVNSYHHQGIKKLGEGFVPMAYTNDGLVEAAQKVDAKFVVGVQFHPERNSDEHPGNRELFKRFIEATVN